MLKIRHRARMREKEVEALKDHLTAAFGVPFLAKANAVDRAEVGDWHVVLADNVPYVILIGDKAYPTLKALLVEKPPKHFVTVDMGAVKFLMNGADVMAPGITEADPSIVPGDSVFIRDERNKQPLAVGEALVPGTSMPRGPKGKAIRAIHHVGDDVWNLEG
ncbi:MAG: PUA domain-containing protein [Thermoplasmatota archaeon]